MLTLALEPEKYMASFLIFTKLESKISPTLKSISIASDKISSKLEFEILYLELIIFNDSSAFISLNLTFSKIT